MKYYDNNINFKEVYPDIKEISLTDIFDKIIMLDNIYDLNIYDNYHDIVVIYNTKITKHGEYVQVIVFYYNKQISYFSLIEMHDYTKQFKAEFFKYKRNYNIDKLLC